VLNFWSRSSRYIGSGIRWLYSSQRIASEALQGGSCQAQGDFTVATILPEQANRLKRTKLILTAASVVAVFVGWFIGRDPSQLSVVLPTLIGSYCAADVGLEYVRNKYGADSTSGSGNNGS
jgi:hypothetical protein